MSNGEGTVTKISDFETLQKLGSGAFSDVFKVKRKSDGQQYALKKVKMQSLSAKEKENALNEVRILASVDHPNLIAFKEAFFEEQSCTLCIVMEFADGGDVQSKINQCKKEGKFIKEEEIWSIFYQMVLGLQELHKHKIVHRDIKSANIFLTKSGMVKLGDLNVSKIAKMGILQTQTGTPYYASPEVWQDKPYDKRSDIWSLGCVLYEITTLNPPFTAKDMKGLYQRVMKGVYPKIPSHFSADLNTMLKALLQVDPKNRPSTKQILYMPVFIAKYNEIREDQLKQNDQAGGEEGEDLLLGTIKMPKNLRLLTERLPKSNYGETKGEKTKEEGKGNKQLASIMEEDQVKKQNTIEQDQSEMNGPKKEKPPLPQNLKQSQAANIEKIKSERLARANAYPRNQLAEKEQQIIKKHRANSNSIHKTPIQSSQENQRVNSEQRNLVRNQQASREDSQTPSNNNQIGNYQKVIQYRKKILIDQVPKSSPSSRNGIEDLYYQIAHGKRALIEKREQKLQNQEQSKGGDLPTNENQSSSKEKEDNPKQGIRYQMYKQRNEENLRQQQSVEENKGEYRVNLPSLPGMGARNALSNQITPKYQMAPGQRIGRNEINQTLEVNTPNPVQNQVRVAGMLPRARSKDSLVPLSNNLREVYKQMGGAQNIVQMGRMESQRLLHDNYRKIDPHAHGYMQPVNLKRQNQQYIPMSQHGQRVLQNYYNMYRPSLYQIQAPQVPSSNQNKQYSKPQWWG